MLTYRVGLNSHKQMSDGINKQFSLLKIDHFDYPFVFNSGTAFYHCTRGPSSCIQQKFPCFIIANITHYCWLHFEAFIHMSFGGHWNSSSAPWCMKTSSVTVNFRDCLALELSVGSDIVLYVVLMQQRKRNKSSDLMLDYVLSPQPVLCNDVLFPLFVACVIC